MNRHGGVVEIGSFQICCWHSIYTDPLKPILFGSVKQKQHCSSLRLSHFEVAVRSLLVGKNNALKGGYKLIINLYSCSNFHGPFAVLVHTMT